jgi:hypothetical protein
MKYIVDLNEIETISAFSPPHHTTTKDRKLVDETMGAKNLAIWHGEIGAGGKADPHFHEEMEQAFFILDGEGIFLKFIAQDGVPPLNRRMKGALVSEARPVPRQNRDPTIPSSRYNILATRK